jgi:hypothetical protein
MYIGGGILGTILIIALTLLFCAQGVRRLAIAMIPRA